MKEHLFLNPEGSNDVNTFKKDSLIMRGLILYGLSSTFFWLFPNYSEPP